MKYLVGVDGGNTKTDYYLFDVNGNFLAMHREGTCSHEGLEDSFDGSYRVMKHAFEVFFKENNVDINDVEAACFGLAGCDIPSQHERLVDVVKRIGFKKFVVVNDSQIGIKAGTTKGYGVCSINGTGTSASGIGMDQSTLQVGGIGEIVGDLGGGRHVAREVVSYAFKDAMRFGKHTSLTPIVMNGLGVTDKLLFQQAISEKFYSRKFDYNQFTIACFDEANKGDEVAIEILTTMADNLARSAASVAVNLELGEHPEICMAGSVYVKGACPVLVNEFKQRVNKYTGKECVFNVLSVPPATGAIIWAKELYDGAFPSLEERQSIIANVSEALAKQK